MMAEKTWPRASAPALFAVLVSLSVPPGAFAGSDADFAREVGGIRASAVKSAQAARLARADREKIRGDAGAPSRQGADGSVVRDRTTVVEVELNPSTVKCSAADYSAPMLKVLVPALAELTILNHRNTREGAPCVAAGRCGEVAPEDILRSGEGVESVPMRVVLKKIAEQDGEACRVSLVETVTTVIRGVPFFHERRQAVEDRAADDCR